jgi:A/G-specific adenine glycosylase
MLSIANMDNLQIPAFQDIVWEYYAHQQRDHLPWRQPESDGSFDPYKIMVSEIMLQQTQVTRVVPKYLAFTRQFPDVATLAAAPLATVLRAWSGLGYNRRAQYLHRAAAQIMTDYHGVFPDALTDLVALRGIGHNTASAILAYAYNQPVVFIETNIRTVFIHHFFADAVDVPDKTLLDLVEQALDHENPREWYWALMDYGSYLKQTVGNLNRQSRHYTKQSTFQGSRRQIRGQVIRLLGTEPLTLAALKKQIADDRLAAVLDDLVAEGLITKRGARFGL